MSDVYLSSSGWERAWATGDLLGTRDMMGDYGVSEEKRMGMKGCCGTRRGESACEGRWPRSERCREAGKGDEGFRKTGKGCEVACKMTEML